MNFRCVLKPNSNSQIAMRYAVIVGCIYKLLLELLLMPVMMMMTTLIFVDLSNITERNTVQCVYMCIVSAAMRARKKHTHNRMHTG